MAPCYRQMLCIKADVFITPCMLCNIQKLYNRVVLHNTVVCYVTYRCYITPCYIINLYNRVLYNTYNHLCLLCNILLLSNILSYNTILTNRMLYYMSYYKLHITIHNTRPLLISTVIICRHTLLLAPLKT
jgi:hypothetical protein